MAGFITIERDLWDHPLFKRSEMTEREAWMWMLAQSAWDDTRHRVGSEMIEVPRGSFVTTLREMQSVFMWRSDKRVRTFLTVLEREGMIGRTTVGSANAPKTHVTICNYDKYQIDGRTKDAPGTHRGRAEDAVKKEYNNTTREEAKASLSAQPTLPDLAHVDEISQAVSAYNEAAEAVGWSKVQKLSRERRGKLAARLREAGGIEGWRVAMSKARASPLCTGDNERGWVASFDFLISKEKFTRLMEGQYDDRKSSRSQPRAAAQSDAFRDLINDAAAMRRTSGADWR
ncbi:hypothetical protein SAMN04489859_1008101 [Paracoccus alcaliphilus]|uniref:Uncharacterized protein n=1 Tax=Paracoccus alcaliphilus TaxID=34002 RepID=A0A1H8H431_9RHOB|nr:hypothetical protein [Paracoccus alcaliphilus]WCR17392.1 hypothetical protein JHW40_13725 [Paracoccus alcaliphilus]SEN50760.1 hypothetical protein SAMN04489859_1008101 [Paracoccus alcaliphilus]